MRVLHVVAADRWTGAAATALQLVEVLRAEGTDARLLFRSGNNLQRRLSGRPWAFPLLAKERGPAGLARSLAVVRRLARDCDLVHAHLPHDHALVRLAFRSSSGGTAPPILRSVRNGRHLRADPFHRLLFRRCAGVGLAHSGMRRSLSRFRELGDVPAVVLPCVPEARFRPTDRDAARTGVGIAADLLVAGAVGKLARDRGQDLFLHALAGAPTWHGLVVGAGEAERALRRLARRLGIADRVTFVGYREEGLETLYAAMDLFVFPAPGSDHGHRAVAEACACGVPTLAAAVPGIRDLVEPGVTGDLYPTEDAAALAALLHAWGGAAERRQRAGLKAAEKSSGRTPADLAAATAGLYTAALASLDRSAPA
ncbi:MAG: glycosyltransferase family 4 protein [Acidobacteriota bacterium]